MSKTRAYGCVSMNDGWMFENNGVGFGPFSQTQLQQLLLIGLLNPDDLVWQSGDERQRRAADLIPSTTLSPSRITPSRWRVPKRLLAAGAGFIVIGVGIASFLSSLKPNKPDVEAIATKNVEPVAEPGMPETPAASAVTSIPAVEAEPLATTPSAVTPHVAASKSQVVGLVVEGNVALASRGAQLFGMDRDPDKVLDGRSNQRAGYGKAKLRTPVVIQFPQAYRLEHIRLNLIPAWLKDGGKDSYYQYTVEVSSDGESFHVVSDRNSGRHRDWQEIRFPAQVVKAIRVVGTFDHPHQTGIRIAEIEAYCSKPE